MTRVPRRGSRSMSARIPIAARLVLPAAAMLLAFGCGGSASSAVPSVAAANPPGASAGVDPSRPAAEPTDGATTDPGAGGDPGVGSSDNGGGPIGGDIGDRSKGSIQATVSGGYTASIDLPYGAALGNLLINGPNTAYLPFTDTTKGTLFLTISDGQRLLVQYAGPDNVGMTNGATPCSLTIDALDAGQAKGSFSCKAMMVIRGDSIAAADMAGTFEAHK